MYSLSASLAGLAPSKRCLYASQVLLLALDSVSRYPAGTSCLASSLTASPSRYDGSTRADRATWKGWWCWAYCLSRKNCVASSSFPFSAAWSAERTTYSRRKKRQVYRKSETGSKIKAEVVCWV